jgi:hypothetical protein
MSIIYSYPIYATASGSDLLLASRFDEEPGGPARTINLPLSAIGSYIVSNHANNLNQVLTEGNESLLDAKVGGIYLYNDHAASDNGYTYITGNKNRFNFYNNVDFNLARLEQSALTFIDPIVTSREFQIGVPSGITTNRVATFQDASGIVAYLSNLDALDLNEVLTNGNISLLNASIGALGLWDNFNEAYGLVSSSKNRFNFTNSDGFLVGYLAENTLTLNDSDTAFNLQIKKPTVITANRTATFQDASGTIAYLSDITAIANYGLATQLANSTPIVNTTTKSTLNGSSYAGTLSVPANGFSVGDSFNAYMMGHISNNNNVGLTITIETVAGVVLATTGLMTLAVSSNNHWTLDADFVIRAIGTTGAASIITAGSFSHSKSSNNNLETYNFISENTTTFDTTIANELVIKAQWGTASASDSIYSNVFILNKVY